MIKCSTSYTYYFYKYKSSILYFLYLSQYFKNKSDYISFQLIIKELLEYLSSQVKFKPLIRLHVSHSGRKCKHEMWCDGIYMFGQGVRKFQRVECYVS